MTLRRELPFVLTTGEAAAADPDFSADENRERADLMALLDGAISNQGAGSSDVQAVAALWRMLLGVGEARRNLDALQGSEATLVALIEKLTGASASNSGSVLAVIRSVLPLRLGVFEGEMPVRTHAPDLPMTAETGSRIRARMLGRFEVSVDGTALPAWRSRRARQLFEYLLLNAGEEVSRHRLMGLFWPDHGEDRAENNLSLTVMTLRRVLDSVSPGLGKRIVYRSGAYVLDSANLWLDISAFDEAIELGRECDKAGDASAAADAYDAAIELYAGELLPGELYEEWTAGRRQRLQDSALEIFQRRAALGRLNGDFELSIRLNQRALEIDPALEAAHRQLILDYLETGQRSRAAQQVEACRDALRHHLGEEPDSESQAVFARVSSTR